MSAVYNDLTDDEIEARQALLRSLGVKPRKPDTRGDVAPRRRPLGLAPVPGDAPEAGGDDDNMDAEGRVILHDGYSFSFKDGVSPEFLAASAPVDLVYEMANAVTSIADEVHRKAKKNIAEVRSEVAELKAALIEARHEIRELKLIHESMRVAGRGERGTDGPRGVPGRDGLQGPIGPRGEQGERGPPAASVVAWEPRPDWFELVPVYADGSRGVPANLRSLFEAYDAATEGEDE
jgi:hypothetical protein